jgi:hypothetical protein
VAVESLSFNIFANDRASETFRRLGLAAKDASGDVRTLGDRLDKLGTRVSAARVKLDGNKEANAELDKLDVKLIRLGQKVASPDITVEGKIRALADIAAVDVAMDKLNKKFAKQSLATKAAGAGAFAPSLMGSALALSPALIPLAGGIAAGIGAIGVSFGAATIGAGLFGLAAKSVLTTASSNLTKLQALELAVNKATTAATKKSAEAALAALKKTFAPGYMALLDQLSKFKAAWTKTSQTIAVPALSAWLPALTAGMPLLVTAVKPVGDVFKNFGDILRTDFANPAIMKNLQGMAASFGTFSAGQINLLGRGIADFALGVYHLGKDLAGSGVNFASAGVWFASMGSGFLTWSKSAKARADVQGFLRYLHDNGPVVKSILSDLGSVLPGIFAGAKAAGTLELQAISTFLGFVAGLPQGWQKPLTEAAGAMLLLSKTGVLSVGLKLTGKLAEHPTAFGFSIGTLLAAGIIAAVNQHKPGEKSIWQRFSPPPKGQQQTWLNSWAGLGDRIVQIADDSRHQLSRVWDNLWNHTLSTTKQGDHDVATEFDRFRHNIAATWDLIWRNTAATVRNGIATVVSFFKALPARALGALRGFGHSLYAFGHAALTEFLNGLKSIGGTVLSWLKNFIGGIPSAIMHFLHMSPPHAGSAFYDLGANIMRHLGAGIKSTAHQAVGAAKGALGAVSGALGGDARANEALARKIFPWGTDQWPSFVNLVMAESGFNRYARNPTSGAYGIAQALPPTKYPFAGQAAGGSHAGAQLSWMFNYIAQRYGTPAGAWAHELSAHWYDSGGWLPPGVSVAVNKTGQPERVLPPGGSGAPLVQFGDVHIHDETDTSLLAQRLSFAVTTAGLGS